MKARAYFGMATAMGLALATPLVVEAREETGPAPSLQEPSPEHPAAIVTMPEVAVDVSKAPVEAAPASATTPTLAGEAAPEASPVVVPMPSGVAVDLSPAPVQEAEAAIESSPAPTPTLVGEAGREDAPVVVPMPPEVAVDLSPAPVKEAQAAPAIAPAPAVSPVQAALKSAIETRLAERASASQRRFREAVAAVYEAREWRPLWLADDRWTEQAASAIARLERAGDDALDLRGAPVPVLRATGPESLAAADLALSESVAVYAREASGGRIDPRSISNHITARPEVVDPARSLVEVSTASDAGATLEAYNPQHRGYRALREKLAEVRQAAPAVAHRPIPMGPVLKPGMKDQRVPLIRARFGLDKTDETELLYDTRVAEAVAGFQKANGLPASGALTARTVTALSGGQPSRLEHEIISNMERWRWMPRDMGEARIEVNIPDYMVRVYRGDQVVHQARVIVGKPQTPTPVFSNTMQFLIVNPYWHVPPSILKNEMLPKLREDPTYLQRLGYEVINRNGRISVRQPPGERNALGFIKFMFPNDHAVYLHDTPTRHLFANAKRAYSHGCVRVDQPFALAEIVLGEGWTEERVRKLKGGPERTVRMPKPLPIHIGYFSAFVDDQGKLQLREDLYGYSQKVRAALGLSA